jgi:hypothetical protein
MVHLLHLYNHNNHHFQIPQSHLDTVSFVALENVSHESPWHNYAYFLRPVAIDELRPVELDDDNRLEPMGVARA